MSFLRRCKLSKYANFAKENILHMWKTIKC